MEDAKQNNSYSNIQGRNFKQNNTNKGIEFAHLKGEYYAS